MVSDPVENWDGEKGFLDEARIRRLVPDFAERTSYICGPQIMNDFCKSALEAMGVPEKRIRREMFGARKDIQNEPGWPAELSEDEVFTITVGEKENPRQVRRIRSGGFGAGRCPGECVLPQRRMQPVPGKTGVGYWRSGG